MRSIFAVVNDNSIRFIIENYLMREGYKVSFTSQEEIMLCLQSVYPDMFILDLAPIPEWWGFCRELKINSGIPCILIFSREVKINDLQGFKLKEDDYIYKPFNPRELVARVASVFRRSPLPVISEDVLMIGNITINPNDRYITIDNCEVLFTANEYELLLVLAKQPQRTFTRQELLDRVWGYDYVGRSRAVDDLVKRLRKKLRNNGATKNVRTVWGFGYYFEK